MEDLLMVALLLAFTLASVGLVEALGRLKRREGR